MVVPWNEVGNSKPVTWVVFTLEISIGMFRLAGLGFVITKVPFSLVAITVRRKVSPPAGSVPNTGIEIVAMLLGAGIFMTSESLQRTVEQLWRTHTNSYQWLAALLVLV